MDPVFLLKSTFSGLFPLVSVTVSGMALAYFNIFDKSVNHSIAKAFTNFFNPVFVFFYICNAIQIDQFSIIWPLFFTPTLNFVLGWMISSVFCKLFKLDKSFAYTLKCAVCFGNLGNLMIVLLRGACSSYGPLSGYPECKDASSYISIQVLTYNPLVWSVGTSFIFTGKKHYKALINEISTDNQLSIWKTTLNNLLLPGPIACYAGFLAALVPGLKDFLFLKSSAFYSVTHLGFEIGLAGVVLAQASLGSNLVLLSKSKLFMSKGMIFWVIVFKNFLMPSIGLGVVWSLWELGIFGENIVMSYIVFISFCTPSAIITLVICENLNHGLKEITWLLLGVYSASLPSLVLFTCAFFFIIG